MNQISVETNVVETETNELQGFGVTPAADAIKELSCAQLSLVGGGLCVVLLM